MGLARQRRLTLSSNFPPHHAFYTAEDEAPVTLIGFLTTWKIVKSLASIADPFVQAAF